MSSVISKNFQIGADTTATNNFTIYQPATPNGTLLIGNGNTGITSSLVALTSAGNVGIGTSSPSTKLHISGTAATSAITIFSTGTTTGYNVGQFTNTGGSFFYGTDNSAGTTFGGSSAYASVVGSGNGTNLHFITNAAVKATLDTSGNLGLGVTPSAWNTSVYKALELPVGVALASYVPGGATPILWLGSNAYFGASNVLYKASAAAALYQQNQGIHQWSVAPSGTAGNAITFTQAMTLDASGALLVGSTSIGSVGGFTIRPLGTYCRLYLNSNGVNDVFDFAQNGTQVGRIQIATTQTFYVTTSDYRLKEDIAPMTGALAKVALLKPCTYKWKVDGSDGQGFIAHELAEVVPNSVAGEKDAVDEDGKPAYQGIDTSFLVATLTAAIQEQQALILSLQADVAALKAAA